MEGIEYEYLLVKYLDALCDATKYLRQGKQKDTRQGEASWCRRI